MVYHLDTDFTLEQKSDKLSSNHQIIPIEKKRICYADYALDIQS